MGHHCHDSFNSKHVHVNVNAGGGITAGKAHLLQVVIGKLCNDHHGAAMAYLDYFSSQHPQQNDRA